jgi:ribosomal protein L21E
MSREFQIGDHIKVVKSPYSYYAQNGKTGVVVSLMYGAYGVVIDDDIEPTTEAYWVTADEIEKVD